MSVYTIGDNKDQIEKSTVNILPTAVNFIGTVPNGTSNWESYKEVDKGRDGGDGNPVNYLRGRKLVGVTHTVDNYQAVLFEKENGKEDSYNAVSASSDIVTYEHQVPASVQNDQVERVEEWVGIARFINTI